MQDYLSLVLKVYLMHIKLALDGSSNLTLVNVKLASEWESKYIKWKSEERY